MGKKNKRKPQKTPRSLPKKKKEEGSDSEWEDDLSSDEDISLDLNSSESDDAEQEEDIDDDDVYQEDSDYNQEDEGPSISSKENPLMPPRYRIGEIKNKLIRSEMYLKFKQERDNYKKKQRKEKDPDAPKQEPRTIENTREPEDSTVQPDDEEDQKDLAVDEFASYFSRERPPKIIVTTVDHPRAKTIRFCKEFSSTIPNAEFRYRQRSAIKDLVKDASKRGYTDVMIVNEDRRVPNGLLVIHLPDGPTANFKLTSVKYRKDLKKPGSMTYERPEVIVNNLKTRLGVCVGRMLASLYHFDPDFKGRRVVTFHNQRDYIFFRHHRYEFKNGQKVALKEIGPRFTLKLRWLQKGTFDTKTGEYEWVWKPRDSGVNRRKFAL